MVKKVIHVICYPLCAIFNLSISTGVVPYKMKIAKVAPIFKSGSKEDVSNYRPISVLPLFSKMLEKYVYCRLSYFLEKCNIISNYQYGFRHGYSTSSALTEFLHKV